MRYTTTTTTTEKELTHIVPIARHYCQLTKQLFIVVIVWNGKKMWLQYRVVVGIMNRLNILRGSRQSVEKDVSGGAVYDPNCGDKERGRREAIVGRSEDEKLSIRCQRSEL